MRRAGVGLWLLGIVAVTALRADLWGQPADLIIVNARYHPHSARSLYEAGRMYYMLAVDAPTERRGAYYQETRAYLLRTAEADESYAAALISLLRLDAVLDRPFDQQLNSRILEQLRGRYVSTLTAETLRSLNGCQLHGACPLPPHVLAGLLDAILANAEPERSAPRHPAYRAGRSSLGRRSRPGGSGECPGGEGSGSGKFAHVVKFA